MAANLQTMQQDALDQMAKVSFFLRQAINNALPVAPEQYLTISIPGTVIDVRDIKDGGTYVYDQSKIAFPPFAVQQAEAHLVDNMVPLANVMIGNTGKSVSRSYNRALDCLVPKKATVTSNTSGNSIRSPGDQSYDDAMLYLTTKDAGGKTPVDYYNQKQTAWAIAQTLWDKAKLIAMKNSKEKYPNDNQAAVEDYNEWSQTHYRTFKFAVQGKYIDWVTNGFKYNVEYNFGVVDVDSIMARVETSKESYRNSTIVDANGSNEVQTVSLTPKNWAQLCKQKSDGWYTRNGDYSLEQLDAEIARLSRLKLSFEALQDAAGTTYPLPASTTAISDPRTAADTTLKSAFTDLYKAEGEMNKEIQSKATDVKTQQTALDAARTKLKTAVDDDRKAHEEFTKSSVATLSGDAGTRTKNWIGERLADIESQLDALVKKRSDKEKTSPAPIVAVSGGDGEADQGDGGAASENSTKANPVFGLDNNTSTDTSNPWTSISAFYTASQESSETTKSDWGMSAGVSVGWGLWSAGGSYAHDQSQSDTSSDMSKCDVSVSFDAMVVNVERPWLFGELFSDTQLDVPQEINLSPGPEMLQKWMKDQGTDSSAVVNLSRYSMFPAYPTSFVVAADVTIEFTGATQHIESHFSSHSNAGSATVGYGPFSVSSSFHESSSKQSFQMHSTATGCKLLFAAPQVIGWVSQILPQLPRDPNFEPMVQGPVS